MSDDIQLLRVPPGRDTAAESSETTSQHPVELLVAVAVCPSRSVVDYGLPGFVLNQIPFRASERAATMSFQPSPSMSSSTTP